MHKTAGLVAQNFNWTRDWNQNETLSTQFYIEAVFGTSTKIRLQLQGSMVRIPPE